MGAARPRNPRPRRLASPGRSPAAGNTPRPRTIAIAATLTPINQPCPDPPAARRLSPWHDPPLCCEPPFCPHAARSYKCPKSWSGFARGPGARMSGCLTESRIDMESPLGCRKPFVRQAGPAHLDVGDVERDLIVELAELAGDRLGPPTMKLIGWPQRSSGRAGSGVSAGILPRGGNTARAPEGRLGEVEGGPSSGPTNTGRLAAISPVPPASR